MADTEQFSITLPTEAIEMIDNGLVPFGLYGKKRATVCSTLILDMLKSREVQANVAKGRENIARPDAASSPSTAAKPGGEPQR